MRFRIFKFFAFVFCGFFLVSANAQVPKNLSLVGSLFMPGDTLAGCWHYEDSLGHQYALIGAYTGISIIDLDTPSTPRLLFHLPGVRSWWHEVKVQGDYAYAVSEGFDNSGVKNGVQIIDLRFLPDSAPYVFYHGDGAISNSLTKGHSITTEGHYMYVNGHNIGSLGRGVIICDITDPMTPQYIGAVTQNYCHDSYVRGDTIWTSDINDGVFTVYDITNRANPIQRAQHQTPFQFNHNTWLSDNGQYLYTTDEQHNAPLASFDVSDLQNITRKDLYFTINEPTEEVHNVRVLNDFLVNADYGSQVTIVDAAYPDNLIEIGNYPTGNDLCWDVDPYLSSGLVIATDMMSCTFYVLQPNYIRACYLVGNVMDSITGFPINTANVKILATAVLDSTIATGDYKTGIADSGFYDISYSKTGYTTKTFTNVHLESGVQLTMDVKLVPVGAGVEQIDLDETIVISPNPFEKSIRISTEKATIRQVRIMDSTGRLLTNIKYNSGFTRSHDLSLENFSSGTYSIEIITDEGRVVKKVIRK